MVVHCQRTDSGATGVVRAPESLQAVAFLGDLRTECNAARAPSLPDTRLVPSLRLVVHDAENTSGAHEGSVWSVQRCRRPIRDSEEHENENAASVPRVPFIPR